jgi:hypothetical protein
MGLLGDGREVAKQVNQMMHKAEHARGAPTHKREVQYIPEGWFFGHYDSRGGGSLLLVRGIVQAIKRYAEFFSFGDKPEDQLMAEDTAYEDLLGRYEIVVLDKPLPDEGGEVLAPYIDPSEQPGWKLAKLYVQSVFPDKPDQFKPREANVAVFYQGKRPKFKPNIRMNGEREMWREVYTLKRWNIGEDACGCVVMH